MREECGTPTQNKIISPFKVLLIKLEKHIVYALTVEISYAVLRGVALTFFIGMAICKKLSVLVWPNAILAIPNFFWVWPNIKVQND